MAGPSNSDNINGEMESEDFRNMRYLPYVPLLKIFSFLNVKDRIMCSMVCKYWRSVVYSPQLWTTVYPYQWAFGYWEDNIFEQTGVEEVALKEKRLSRMWLKTDLLLPGYFHSHELSRFKGLFQEFKVFKGFIKYLLPRIGFGVQKCGFATSSVARDNILNITVLACPNLTHLDLSFTDIGDEAFYGLWEFDTCMNLQYLNFTCCYNLTDRAISNLVRCWMDKDELSEDDTGVQTISVKGIDCDVKQAYNDLMEGSADMLEQFRSWTDPIGSILLFPFTVRDCASTEVTCANLRKRRLAGLQYLNLSGCILLTDQSLYSFSKCKDALKNLQFLDVSGNCFFTSKGLSELVKWCPSLQPEHLYYCVSLVDGPFKFNANGCSNLQSSTRPCCIPLE